jgi:hypothetical protein
MKDKIVNSYVEFLDEMDKGKKEIKVTEEFFEWLRENIGESSLDNTPRRGPIGMFHGITVTKVKAERV